MALQIDIEPLNERALLLRPAFDAATGAIERNESVHQLAGALRAARLTGMRDVVVAYETLAVFWDDVPSRLNAQRSLPSLLSGVATARERDASMTVIPVRYDGEDLDACARHAGLSVSEFVAAHTAPTYTVAMIGFAPGFPYLLGMDPRLAKPRHATPRAQVPAGSVAIGGVQTGVYPAAGPGGWNLIGVTDFELFDPAQSQPSSLRAGDHVRFEAVA